MTLIVMPPIYARFPGAALPAYVLEDYYINSADCNSVGSRMKAAHQITAYYCQYVPRNGVALYVQY